jgi:hypothetical protein
VIRITVSDRACRAIMAFLPAAVVDLPKTQCARSISALAERPGGASSDARPGRRANRLQRRAEEEIGGDASVKPTPRIEPCYALRRTLNVGIAEPQLIGVGDQRSDDGVNLPASRRE